MCRNLLGESFVQTSRSLKEILLLKIRSAILLNKSTSEVDVGYILAFLTVMSESCIHLV